MTLRKARLMEIKQLRADARRLDTIAKHLRARANALADEIKRDERVEKAQTNFYSKKSKIDPGLVLTPNAPDINTEMPFGTAGNISRTKEYIGSVAKTENNVEKQVAELNELLKEWAPGHYAKYGHYADAGEIFQLFGPDNKVHYIRKTFEEMKHLITDK